MKHVVMCSSGAGSAIAGKRVVDRYGPDDVTLLFADVNGEDDDNYRFLAEVTPWIGAELVVLDNDGKTIWDVFKAKRFLGNSRIDPCSRVLKREPMRRWLEDNRDPADTVAYIGYDWTEEHRVKRSRAYWTPWEMDSPLMWEPMLDKYQVLAVLADAGIKPPALTREGFPHANCGGGCVKAGIGQFKRLLQVRPDTFAEWERNEEEMRDLLGDVAILTDRTHHMRRPLPLRTLRLRVESEPTLFDGEDYGACNCMMEPEDVETELI
jgi:hypothetical protein